MSPPVTLAELLSSEDEPNNILVVLFIPSKDKNGALLNDQPLWADAAGNLLSRLFGGSTELPPAKGKWLNDETGEIITEEVVLIHCYTRTRHVNDEAKIKDLARFLHRMGRETNQGEIAVVIGEVFHRIRKFTLE